MSAVEGKLSGKEKKTYNRILTKSIRQEQSKLKQLDRKYEKGNFTEIGFLTFLLVYHTDQKNQRKLTRAIISQQFDSVINFLNAS